MRSRLLCTLAVLVAAAGARAANHEVVVNPVILGPFKVACSNIEQDTGKIAASGALATDFWEGRNGKYITEILSFPASALRVDAPVPGDSRLYPQFHDQNVPHVAIVCHPTTATNTDPDYTLPGSTDKVPHMLPAGAQPRLPMLAEYLATLGYTRIPKVRMRAPMPLIVFSHGLGGSPIGSGYIDAIVALASHGYIVAAVFHGDSRFSRIRIEDLGDVLYLFTDFNKFVELELMRPVSLKAFTDLLLAHPDYAGSVDTNRIAAFGASLGGQAVINLLGARLSTTIGLSCQETVRDPRIQAAVGLVPYAGQSFLPSFCDGQNGAADVTKPFLAMSGTADTTAPIKQMQQAINLMPQSHYLVELQGVKHEFKAEFVGDVMTWTVTFLRAYLGGFGSEGAMAKLIRMNSVNGGPVDDLIVDFHVPFPPQTGEALANEFYNNPLDRYFLTADPALIALLFDGPGWEVTRGAFRVSLGIPPLPQGATTDLAPVCRFDSFPGSSAPSQYLTIDSQECQALRSTPGWHFAGTPFYAHPVGTGGTCATGELGVMRAFNGKTAQGTANYRLSTSDSMMREQLRMGWTLQGTSFCVVP